MTTESHSFSGEVSKAVAAIDGWLGAHPDAPAEQRTAARVVRDNVADLTRLDNPSGRARTLAAMAVAEMIFAKTRSS